MPYGINTHRLLVRGVRQGVDYKPIVTDAVQQSAVTTEPDPAVTTTRTPVETEIAEDGTPIIYVANEAFRIQTFVVMAIPALPMLTKLLICQIIRGIAAGIRNKKHNAEDRKTTDESTDIEESGKE